MCYYVKKNFGPLGVKQMIVKEHQKGLLMTHAGLEVYLDTPCGGGIPLHWAFW